MEDDECCRFRAQGLTVTSVGEWEGEKEIWVKLPAFEGYELSTMGRMKNRQGKMLKFVENKGYYKTNLSRECVYTTVRIHKLVLETFGTRPMTTRQLVVDHINQNPLDNRLCNLRWATLSENGMNTKLWSTNTSGTKGVQFIPSRNRYLALIQWNGTKHNLGYFKTLQEAIDARKAAEQRLCGAFTST